jgi:hypothetical protein
MSLQDRRDIVGLLTLCSIHSRRPT